MQRSQVAGRDDRGNSTIEYAMIVALIAVVVALGVGITGRATTQSFSAFGSSLAAHP